MDSTLYSIYLHVASHLRQLVQGSPQDLLSHGPAARIRSGQGPSDFAGVRQQGQAPVVRGGHIGSWRYTKIYQVWKGGGTWFTPISKWVIYSPNWNWTKICWNCFTTLFLSSTQRPCCTPVCWIPGPQTKLSDVWWGWVKIGYPKLQIRSFIHINHLHTGWFTTRNGKHLWIVWNHVESKNSTFIAKPHAFIPAYPP